MRRITKIVAYYRLSTPMKGKSKNETIRDAYGLEVQQRAVAKIAAEYNAPIIGEFTEIMTGTNSKHREELEKAILMTHLHHATLVVSKQYRLSRSVCFIASLLESGLDFISADCPNQTKRETLFRAIIDEEETDRIADRTRRAHAIAKENGVLLGSARPGHWEGREHLRGFRKATAASIVARRRRVHETYDVVIGQIIEMQREGMPYYAIAQKLNAEGHHTMGNNSFTAASICTVLQLYRWKPVKHFVTGKCTKCDREFRVSWEERQHPEQPLVCHRCRRNNVPARDTVAQRLPATGVIFSPRMMAEV